MPGHDDTTRPYRITVGSDPAHDTGHGTVHPAQDWAVTVGLTGRGLPEVLTYLPAGEIRHPYVAEGVYETICHVADALLSRPGADLPDGVNVTYQGVTITLHLDPCDREVPALTRAYRGRTDVKVLLIRYPSQPPAGLEHLA